MRNDSRDPAVLEDPQKLLERSFIKEFLGLAGYEQGQLGALPASEVELLMKQACVYASGKLAEVEARAHFIHGIHGSAEATHKPRPK